MKKTILILSIICLTTAFLSTKSYGQVDQHTWYMNYYGIDYSGSDPVISSLPYAPTIHPTKVFASFANGYHDVGGNLLFYTTWYEESGDYLYHIYDNTGNLIGSFDAYNDCRNISILPFDNSQSKYLLVYSDHRLGGTVRNLVYRILDVAADSLTNRFVVESLNAGWFTPYTKIVADNLGNIFMYATIKNSIKKYVIDFSKSDPEIILPDQIPEVYHFPYDIVASEIEVSNSGKKLVIGSLRSNNLEVIDLDANGDFAGIQSYLIGSTNLQNHSIAGVEFNPADSRIYVNYYDPYGCQASGQGIFIVDLLTNSVTSSPIAGTNKYNRSHLKLASDGYLYALGFDESSQKNMLARIDIAQNMLVDEYELPDLLPYSGDYHGYSCTVISGTGIFTLPCNTSYVTKEITDNTCCPGVNLVLNGNFSVGAIGFSSDFMAQPVVSANSILPGQFGIVNGNEASTISNNWNSINDPGTCEPSTGRYLLVNGENGGSAVPSQLSNSIPEKKIIWEQDIQVEDWKSYKFCCKAKNLNQCGFNVTPKLEVQFSMPVGNISQTISVTNDPCDWQEITKSFYVGGYGNNLNIKIILDQSEYGDGNDVAIDDIYLKKIDMCPASTTDFDVQIDTYNPGQANAYQLIATASVTQPCTAIWWEVCEIDPNAPDDCKAGTRINAVWWDAITSFPGYVGTDHRSGNNPGIFEYGKLYRITRGTWGDCLSWNSSSMVIGITSKNKKPHKFTAKEFEKNSKRIIRAYSKPQKTVKKGSIKKF